MSRDVLRIRLARPEDARAISVLSRRVVRRWVLPDQPKKIGLALLSRLTSRAIREKIIEGQRFHLAYLNDALVGVAAIREDSHLVHFYIGTRYQGRGFARRLWRRMLLDAVRRAGTRCFTVNAVRRAVPIYARFGFRENDSEGPSRSGVIITPMKLRLPIHRGKEA